MKACLRCSRDNDDKAENCTHCGAELEILEKTTATVKHNIPVNRHKIFSTRVKFYFWFSACAGAALIVLAINPAYFRATLLFPVGLFALFPIGDRTGITASMIAMQGGIFIFGWALYAVLTAMIFRAESQRAFMVRYLIFCVLLLLNIGGCHHISASLSGIQ